MEGGDKTIPKTTLKSIQRFRRITFFEECFFNTRTMFLLFYCLAMLPFVASQTAHKYGFREVNEKINMDLNAFIQKSYQTFKQLVINIKQFITLLLIFSNKYLLYVLNSSFTPVVISDTLLCCLIQKCPKENCTFNPFKDRVLLNVKMIE